MKKIIVSIVSAAALASVGMAAASNSTVASDQTFSSNNASGIFVSGNMGYSNVNQNKNDYQPVPATSLTTGGFAWNANIGYQFNKYLALEGGYTSLAKIKATDAFGATDTTTLGGINLDAKGILPINSQVDLFAKAGAVDWHENQNSNNSGYLTKVTGSAWTPEFGVGADYNVTSNVAVSLQDIYTLKTSYNVNQNGLNGTVNIPTTNSILAGMSYKFNM